MAEPRIVRHLSVAETAFKRHAGGRHHRFHTQFHCNNFLDTVDRFLESRIDYENFSVHREGHTTWVKPFPISIAFSEDYHPPSGDGRLSRHEGEPAQILRRLG